MTDEEIVKDLEEAVHYADSFVEPLKIDLIEDTLDLIIHQKVEIERLKGSTIVSNIMESQRIKREAKAEAYKEFAERLKEKSFKTIRNYGLTKDVVEVCDIDNLVKETVGEDNA